MQHKSAELRKLAKTIEIKTGARKKGTGFDYVFKAEHIHFDDEKRVIRVEGQEPTIKGKGVYIGIDIPLQAILRLFVISHDIEEKNRTND